MDVLNTHPGKRLLPRIAHLLRAQRADFAQMVQRLHKSAHAVYIVKFERTDQLLYRALGAL